MKRFLPQQIVEKLRQADVNLDKGMGVADVCRKIEVSQQTYYRWRKDTQLYHVALGVLSPRFYHPFDLFPRAAGIQTRYRIQNESAARIHPLNGRADHLINLFARSIC